jgi:hypothetical protein
MLFISCDPATAIYVTNRTKYNIFIEYEFNEFDIPYKDQNNLNSNIINNNFQILSGENESIIYLFQATRIIERLGFGSVKKEDDIITAIDSIFKWIKVNKEYEIIGETPDGKGTLLVHELLYDKSYFLDKKNFKWHKFPPGNYSIEFIIK